MDEPFPFAGAQASDWTPAAYAARPRRREAKPNCRERKKTRAKVVQLSLKLDFLFVIARPCTGADRRPPLFSCRNSASAKVVQLLLELLFCGALAEPRAERRAGASAIDIAPPLYREWGAMPHNDRVCHLEHSPCHPERSEGSLEWCRACWRVTRILHLRFRMTGCFGSE